MTDEQVEFDARAAERLRSYVYALFDPAEPRQPFYIGKGQGNRVFDHARGVTGDHDHAGSMKLAKIASIRRAGHRVKHVIVRHGLTEDEALKIEASLIDFVHHLLPDTLTNLVAGHGTAEGLCDAIDLALELRATPLSPDRPLLLIKIERRWRDLIAQHGASHAVPDADIMEAVRGDWKLSVGRAVRAECVLAVAGGLVRGVYHPNGWLDVGAGGRKVMAAIEPAGRFQHYVGMSVGHLTKKGDQNPVRYLQPTA